MIEREVVDEILEEDDVEVVRLARAGLLIASSFAEPVQRSAAFLLLFSSAPITTIVVLPLIEL